MGSGYLKKKKQAKMFHNQVSSMQNELMERLEGLEFTGVAGNGLVSITLNGSYEMKRVSMKPECIDPEDIEGLEVLIKAAYQDANNKIKEYEAQLMDSSDLSFMGM
jgi:DNA-binding YbaB/EbfC family protein